MIRKITRCWLPDITHTVGWQNWQLSTVVEVVATAATVVKVVVDVVLRR